MTKQFQRILIANRGEIACRIMRTCQRLGIETVAVASFVDQDLPHVRLADYAEIIEENQSQTCYLDQIKLLEIARKYKVDAVHPGYGFLSENADFAELITQAGIKFIGPASETIQMMASKSRAKELAEEVEVPIIKGYKGKDQTPVYLEGQATSIGFPLLIKATLGGGGKGMRLVKEVSEFIPALEACQREARKAFDDDTVMLEKFIENPRHIEVQIMGDILGNIAALSDRDCSLQRRHQKVIEEAPALGISETLRQQLREAAVKISKAVKYEGAGTVEFLVDSRENFYFLEMNTRLQVEHPVTEMILGLDLVEWQIRIAQGESLPLAQDLIIPQGHAIEVRLYAEDPQVDFLPSTGVLKKFVLPEKFPFCRVDTGYTQGNKISIYYDPLLAKIITYAQSRQAAIHNLCQTLASLQVEGVKTNIKFLLKLLSYPEVVNCYPDVGFIDRLLQKRDEKLPFTNVEKAFLGVLLWYQERQPYSNQGSQSPWAIKDDWRLGGGQPLFIHFKVNNQEIGLHLLRNKNNFFIEIEGQSIKFTNSFFEGSTLIARHEGGTHKGQVILHSKEEWLVKMGDKCLELQSILLSNKEAVPQESDQQLTALMPGRVISLAVAKGDEIETGAPIMILEAMKMEQTIRAPFSGIVETINYKVGDFVERGAKLVLIKESV